MRVISGVAKGRRLVSPSDRRIRPTSDRIKEALFSIIGSMRGDFVGCRVLDLFAGTGNLGIEALSRGGSEAVFIDNHRTSAALILKNLAATGFSDRAEVMVADTFTALAQLDSQGRAFDLVFADPPYDQGIVTPLLERLSSLSILGDDALVIIETASREELETAKGKLNLFDRRFYGDTAIAFYTSN